MTQRPCDSVTQQKSEPIYRPFLQSVAPSTKPELIMKINSNRSFLPFILLIKKSRWASGLGIAHCFKMQ